MSTTSAAQLSRTTRHLPASFVRFALSQRIEHALLMVSFTMLSLTGIPQKFHTASWADWMMMAMGGIEAVRQLHHFFAAVFIAEAIYHAGSVGYTLFVKRAAATMLPGINDVREALHLVFHYFGLSPTKPRHDRFDFRQKFEYWGIIWGGLVMIITGLVIWFPVQATQWIPGELVPAAKAAHGGEALLAVLVIATWHMYSTHLSSAAFPLDTSIFTGRLSRERMLEEHPLEYERLSGRPAYAATEDERSPIEVGRLQ